MALYRVFSRSENMWLQIKRFVGVEDEGREELYHLQYCVDWDIWGRISAPSLQNPYLCILTFIDCMNTSRY